MREEPTRMSEAELLTQFTTLGQAFLSGILAAFTVVSAYVVALYTFLGNAPLPLKVVAFVFFTAILALLGVFLVGALFYADGVATALTAMARDGQASSLARLVAGLVNHDLAYGLAFASVGLGVCLYGALYYLTFHYDWPLPPQVRSS